VTILVVGDSKAVDINTISKQVIPVDQDTDVDFAAIERAVDQSSQAVFRSFDHLSPVDLQVCA
jgi:hypothetical protein